MSKWIVPIKLLQTALVEIEVEAETANDACTKASNIAYDAGSLEDLDPIWWGDVEEIDIKEPHEDQTP
jgi:hypothetical protein